MRILVTGSTGMLGSDLVSELASSYDVCGLARRSNSRSQIPFWQVDITNRSSVSKAFASIRPAIVIHSAAYTDVDGCELNPYQAFLVNLKGTEFVAEASDECGAALFFISTDYVFDGTKRTPYDENDQPNPLSIYGRSKYEAEELLKSRARSVWIIRSSWLFGKNGKNFFSSILRLPAKGEELRVVYDQKGAPTYTKDLAKVFRILIERGSRAKGYTIYHIANSGVTSWFEAAKQILDKAKAQVDLKPIGSEELDRPAKRPLNSVLNMARLKNDFGIELRDWKEALDDFWKESLEAEWQNVIRLQEPSAGT